MNSTKELGFTLIEVVIAMGILAVGIMAMYTMQVSSLRGNATANRITSESTWGADLVETLVFSDYDDSLLIDTDGDGTGKDQNADGIDESGNNFGLDDTDTDADGTRTTTDGVYTIFWNVAIDQPTRDSKKVRIIVQHNNLNRQKTILDYIKSNPI